MSTSPVEIKNPTKQGWLDKESRHIKRFRKRWMVLDGIKLYSFKQEKEFDNPTEIIDLTQFDKCVKSTQHDSDTAFDLVAKFDKKDNNYYFLASSDTERKNWSKHINAAITKANETANDDTNNDNSNKLDKKTPKASSSATSNTNSKDNSKDNNNNKKKSNSPTNTNNKKKTIKDSSNNPKSPKSTKNSNNSNKSKNTTKNSKNKTTTNSTTTSGNSNKLKNSTSNSNKTGSKKNKKTTNKNDNNSKKVKSPKTDENNKVDFNAQRPVSQSVMVSKNVNSKMVVKKNSDVSDNKKYRIRTSMDDSDIVNDSSKNNNNGDGNGKGKGKRPKSSKFSFFDNFSFRHSKNASNASIATINENENQEDPLSLAKNESSNDKKQSDTASAEMSNGKHSKSKTLLPDKRRQSKHSKNLSKDSIDPILLASATATTTTTTEKSKNKEIKDKRKNLKKTTSMIFASTPRPVLSESAKSHHASHKSSHNVLNSMNNNNNTHSDDDTGGNNNNSNGASLHSVSRPPTRINHNDGTFSIIFNDRPFGLTLDPLTIADNNNNNNNNDKKDNKKHRKRKNSDKGSTSMFSLRRKTDDKDKGSDKDKDKEREKDENGIGCIVIGTNETVLDIVPIGAKIISVNKEIIENDKFYKILKSCATATLPCIIKFRDIAITSIASQSISASVIANGREDSEHSLSESRLSQQSIASTNDIIVNHSTANAGSHAVRPFSTRKYSKDDASVWDDSKLLDSLSGMPLIKKAEKFEKDKKWKLAIENYDKGIALLETALKSLETGTFLNDRQSDACQSRIDSYCRQLTRLRREHPITEDDTTTSSTTTNSSKNKNSKKSSQSTAVASSVSRKRASNSRPGSARAEALIASNNRRRPSSKRLTNNNSNSSNSSDKLAPGMKIQSSASSPADKPDIEATLTSPALDIGVSSNNAKNSKNGKKISPKNIKNDKKDKNNKNNKNNNNNKKRNSVKQSSLDVKTRNRRTSTGITKDIGNNRRKDSGNGNKHRKTQSVQVSGKESDEILNNESKEDDNNNNNNNDDNKTPNKPRASRFGLSIAEQKKKYAQMKETIESGQIPESPMREEEETAKAKKEDSKIKTNKISKTHTKAISPRNSNNNNNNDKKQEKDSKKDEEEAWHPHSYAGRQKQEKLDKIEREKEKKKKAKAAANKKNNNSKKKGTKNKGGDSKENDENDDDDETKKKKSKESKQDGEFRDRLMADIVDEKPDVSFKDVQGLENVKLALYETIILPSLMPDIFTGLREPTKGLLLFGPPGNGKTMIAKCVASECDATFFSISASSITSKFVGDAERIMRTLFTLAREKSPSIIFIDEIDSLLTARGGKNEAESSRRIKTEFLIQFDGVKKQSEAESKILVIGATNLPWQLDDAVLRRFGKRIMVPLPDVDTRMGLIQHLMFGKNNKNKCDLNENDLKKIIKKTDGYSCSDLTGLCKDAAMGPLRDCYKLGINLIDIGKDPSLMPKINVSHFMESCKNVRPSLSNDSLKEYFEWNDNFGSKMHLSSNVLPESMRPNPLNFDENSNEMKDESENDGDENKHDE